MNTLNPSNLPVLDRVVPAAHADAALLPVPSGYQDSLPYLRRAIGTGYGRSSGYASRRQYARDSSGPIFRCV